MNETVCSRQIPEFGCAHCKVALEADQRQFGTNSHCEHLSHHDIETESQCQCARLQGEPKVGYRSNLPTAIGAEGSATEENHRSGNATSHDQQCGQWLVVLSESFSTQIQVLRITTV